MRTIRLSDPSPRSKPAKKLEWGSSAWAADSCLVEWSRFEREWLEPRPASAPDLPASAWLPRELPLSVGLAALAVAAALALVILA